MAGRIAGVRWQVRSSCRHLLPQGKGPFLRLGASRCSERPDEATIRLARDMRVSDGRFNRPGVHVTSRYWATMLSWLLTTVPRRPRQRNRWAPEEDERKPCDGKPNGQILINEQRVS